jgi:putative heme-binding domain-containing protein
MNCFLLRTVCCLAAIVCPLAALAQSNSPKLELKPSDHISLIGNTLADRMQHDGWLETMLQSRYPKHELTVRNLGFSGDELTTRLRSQDFGSPEQWLTHTKTNVVLAFFGYNESFGGEEGLAKFKQDLDSFLKKTKEQKFDGKQPPRVVLFSPIAHENLHNRNLPDGAENNARIELYTRAMREVAQANEVVFVDLFTPTKAAYPDAKRRLTINGIHLTSEGNRVVAEIIDRALFTEPTPKRDPDAVEKLRQAIVDKDFCWFQRYRTTDGFSIFGGRADLSFVDGQTNRVVMQREMEVLDAMTANRDRRVWAVAQGGDLKVDDSNTPAFIDVKTNKPGKGPNGAHIFEDGEAAIALMTPGKGLKVNLFADEKQFPELINPVQMSFDTKGRLWVATWPTYPHWKPKEAMNDSLLILEDTDGDGRADKSKAFASDLHNPTGFEFWGGGVIVAMAPDVLFLKDTDGDDVADVRVRLIDGIDSADTHHTASSFSLDPGGALYFQEGTFHHTQVESPYGPPVRSANAGVYRFEPFTQRFSVYVPYGFANPHGHVWDRWGQDIIHDGTGANPYHGAVISGYLPGLGKHLGAPQVYQQRTRPCSGTEILSSRHFPAEFEGNLLVANVIGFQGILRYKLQDKGSSLGAEELEPLVFSSDPSFRPADIETGPDGAVYFTDWQNPIIGHMQHNLRDPSRDRKHGRVYRVTYEGRELTKPAKIAGEPIEKLVELLNSPVDRERYRTKIELSHRPSDEVVTAVQKWSQSLDKNDPNYEHHLMEALWVHQYHNVVNADLLDRMLKAKGFHARAAATRVLWAWRDRVPNSLDTLKRLAADESPRVRLEAVRAASYYNVPEAIEVALISAEFPTDPYLDYVRQETLKALQPIFDKAIASSQEVAFTTDAGLRFLYKNLKTDDLLKRDRNRGVYLELLFRPGVRDEHRREALTGLAKLEKKAEAEVLLDALEKQSGQEESVVFALVRLLTSRQPQELAAIRGRLEQMATTAKAPVLRQLAFLALIDADGNADKAWNLASQSAGSLRDFLSVVPVIPDASVRTDLYPKIEPLLAGLPQNLGGNGKQNKGVFGRYVRIELPRRGTLTLAEVEVFSDGRNIARQGQAKQSATSHGGAAAKALDGNKSPIYSNGGQTHTPEDQPNPWWEVDLGGDHPIERIAILGRGEGFENRLQGFTLKVLDSARNEAFVLKDQPAPKPESTFEVGGGGVESLVRRAAINALVSIRGQEGPAFTQLARLIREGEERPAALRAIQKIPTSEWIADETQPLLDSLLGFIRKLPAEQRTSEAAVDAIQVSYSLAAKLPSNQAQAIRKELGELGVRVIRLSTRPHQMLFDQDRIIVQAGKPAEIVFENNDIMPHNFVVIQPGTLEEIGLQGEAQATQPGALERQYVPQSSNVILASRLLQPRESQRLSFTAPKTPGVYPFVCTYPGHWRRMYGAMYVVENLDAYLADPEHYLAHAELPVKDDLLKVVRTSTDWKLEDFANSLEELHGRSFQNARQVFQIGACAMCHKMNDIGKEVGPDLSKLDPKYTPLDIVKHILEPSLKIDEKYQPWAFITSEGKVIAGTILSETDEKVTIARTNGLPLVLNKDDIDEREKSKLSIMPVGLLNRLTREEILDLVALLVARGDEKNAVFGGHDHAH